MITKKNNKNKEKIKVFFVTKNRHKFDEAKLVLEKYGIEVKQIKEEKTEKKDMSLKQVAKYNALNFYKKYKKPVIIDDTGVFFKAYKNFPGNHPKLMFELLGYKGLLKLIENENREAEFVTILAYKDEKNFKTFEGKLKCIVDDKVNDLNKDVLPYERILLLKNKPLSSFSMQEKNKISHRAVAFRKLGLWLKKNKKKNKAKKNI